MPKRERSAFNFDKKIGPINWTERGAQSISFSHKVKVPKWVPGSKQLNKFLPLATINMKKSGIRGSIGLPNTGFSKRNIKLKDF